MNTPAAIRHDCRDSIAMLFSVARMIPQATASMKRAMGEKEVHGRRAL